MSNAQAFYTLDAGGGNFSSLWKLTRAMKAAGWVYKASSDGTAKDTTGTAANDKWGGNAAPLVDAYPTAFSTISGPWIVLQGPQVLKIAIGAASAGAFVRGEKVTGGTSGATGELVGYVFDATNLGWVIVLPRTGTFTGTEVLTGAISAATVTGTSLKTYTQEVMYAKTATTNNTASIFWIFADASAESASLFSTLASAAGCTATVPPACGGTGNAFPTAAISLCGTGGAVTGSAIGPSTTPTAHSMIACVNATPAAGVSADGTAWLCMSSTSSSTNSAALGIFRLDDTEPGDVCIFEALTSQNAAPASYSRTASTTLGAVVTYSNFSSISSGICNWIGYVARGVGGTPGTLPDVATAHGPVLPSYSSGGTTGTIFVQNNASQVLAQNHPAATKPQAVDTVQLACNTTSAQQVKGRVRWMRWVSLGSLYDTTDGKTWVGWMSNSTTSNPGLLLGPWDGATTPGP